MKENKKTKKSLVTKSKLLQAVEKVLTEKGFTELKVMPICEASDVDKKLIYFHFGDLKGLHTKFILSRDFWQPKKEIPEELTSEVLIDYFTAIYEDNLQKQLLIWELNNLNETLKGVASKREELENQMIDKFIKQQDLPADVRPLLALLVGGFNYLSLRSAEKGDEFCGIDMHKTSDRDRIINTMKMLIDGVK
ncbi:TetR/AcrR family transcriptional regulator [Sphingobacterium alkalisoli]|uniref:TetR/AcrR family transcriptional regulator n=1 Tax=Sphingobacterium alkalisoli TaxID=1874115 RepID=A0A4U0GSK4_9SPHI|nr:TetR/AcrR family transcriptional regulator [Sphingobacterium alkalisoli]TJY61444.1 TetR/AcrR family transcriptional regulator [Sphingobacterium alkalisoli]GGH30350.1 hypothetical protein GCM10011418_42330 [Sphingobacterium alkalisoli]